MKSLLLLFLVCGTAAAGPLRPISACLDPDRARSWHLIDSDEILIDAGRKRFHLQLSQSCPELAFADSVGFHPGNGVGRICGSPGDTVVAPRISPIGIPCRIIEVTPLTKQQYAARLHSEEPAKGTVQIRESNDAQR